ncbi:MAG: DinB family protein [Candidatus Acidiferrales bacterium]
MKETPQQYIQRIRGNLQGQDPLKVQSATPKKLDRLLKGMPAAKLRKRPAPGKWCVAEIIAHLADAELVGGYRIRMILGAPGTPIQAFDQDAWAVALRYDKREARESLDDFRAYRNANIALLKSLSSAQWKHYGMHSERGEETIETITAMFAGHDINHIKQIEGILSSRNR